MEFNASSSGRSSTKKFKSDEIRLLSLKRKHEQWVDQNIKISQSLKSVDSTSFASNRIVFSDSESSDDERRQVASRQEKSNHSGERLSGLQLFDSDEDMNMDGDVHQAENIVNRHIGWKGAKLMHMEMNFSNDKRFRLDERFLDDEIQAETKEVKDEFEPWNDENSDKKGRSGSEMEELDSTLNGGANRGKSAPFSRFDPEDEDHQRWVQSRMKKACHKKNKKDIRNVDRNVKEKDDMLSYPVSHEQYYDIDTDFLESLRKGTSSKSESFSFLRDVIGTNVVSSHTPSVSAKGIIEIRTSTDQETVSAAPSALISIADVQRRPFFIVETAEEISEAVGNFYCKKSMAIIVKRWKLIRPKIVKFYKNQRRQAVKRNRKGMDMEFHKQFLYKSPNRGPFRSNFKVEQVLAEYRARVRDYHPDTSLDKSTACREEFLKLKAAKEVLAELNTRMLYDKWLNSALDIPWETWRDRKVLRMSMHWVTSPTPCMISDGNTSNEFEARKLSIPTFSDTLRKFRNYEL